MAKPPTPRAQPAATAAQQKNLLRLLESNDAAARAQGKALLASLADPTLYEAVLAKISVDAVREGTRMYEPVGDKAFEHVTRRPFRAEFWTRAWHWPAGSPGLLQANRPLDDDGFALIASAPDETPARARLREAVTRLSVALYEPYKTASHFEASYLAPYAKLEALSLTVHRHWPLDGARLKSIAQLPSLRELSLNGVTLPDGLAGLEGATGLELLELQSKDLASLASLPPLPRLRTLLLRDAASLVTLGEPGRFPALSHFVALSAGALRELRALEGCEALTSVQMLWAPQVASLDALAQSTALETLALYGLRGVRSLDALGGARALSYVDLVDMPALETLAPLPGSRIETLCAERTPRLKSLGEPRSMPRLRRACFYRCDALDDVRALREAPALERFEAPGASELCFVDSLTEKPALSLVDVRRTGVRDAAVLETLAAARALGLAATKIEPSMLSARTRAAASFHPNADLDALAERPLAHIARLAAQFA